MKFPYKSLPFLILLIFILGSSFLVFRASFPQGEFRSPINYKMALSGTYGELRPNHFHAGIDIKSPNGRSGADIVATADGYVTRIKVRSGGYGNALYMNHPNGYTTVYGHLSKFGPAIEKYVKRQQYKKKSFSVDLHPPSDLFRFKKGERIAFMGNTGTSSGPHLHFEIRDRRTEEPLNALLFGLPLKDNIAPKLHKLKTYLLDEQLFTYKEQELKLVKKGKKYHLLTGDTLVVGTNQLGLALKAFDHMEGSSSWNGVYAISMKVDDVPSYAFRLDRFSFSDTRMVNAHLDYEDKVTKNSTYHRMYSLPGNRLQIYQHKEGIIRFHDNTTRKVELVVADASGNTSNLTFWVKKGALTNPPEKSFNYLFSYTQPNQVEFGGLACEFPSNTFYENIYFKMDMKHKNDDQIIGPTYMLHELTTPVQRYFNISIPADMLTASQRARAFIAHKDKKGNWKNAGGKWQYNKMEGRVRSLGEYAIMVDNTPPTITPKRFANNMKKYNSMSFKISDNFSTTGTAKSLRYRAEVDGKWILMEYRNSTLTYTFDEHVQKGQHVLKIVVTDGLGNETVFKKSFIR